MSPGDENAELSASLDRFQLRRERELLDEEREDYEPMRRELGPLLNVGGGRLEVSLVPRLGIPVERWMRAPDDSRLRLVTRLEVRYVEPAPNGWESMPPAWLAQEWERAQPA